jgi:hypothetical protein
MRCSIVHGCKDVGVDLFLYFREKSMHPKIDWLRTGKKRIAN